MTHQTPPAMRVHTTYPPNTSQSFWRRNRQALWRSAFVLAGYLCLIINLLTQGPAWSLIVIGGLMTVWIALIYQPQVEATPIKSCATRRWRYVCTCFCWTAWWAAAGAAYRGA